MEGEVKETIPATEVGQNLGNIKVKMHILTQIGVTGTISLKKTPAGAKNRAHGIRTPVAKKTRSASCCRGIAWRRDCNKPPRRNRQKV